ncbi:MAG: hypothetical protein ACOYON_12155 [Fimbriimonas sp.]
MRIIAISIVGLVGLALIGCGNRAPGYTPAPREAVDPVKVDVADKTSLMPMRVGSQWIYSLEIRKMDGARVLDSGSGEVVYKVVKSEETNGTVRATLELSQGDKVVDRQRWTVSAAGVYQASVLYDNKDTPFLPTPQPIVMSPPTDGQKFTWKGTGITPAGSPGQMSFESTTELNQEVDTEIDRFSAVAIRTITKFKLNAKDGRAESNSWFTPGVGLVRYVQETAVGSQSTAVVLKLKSFSLR